MRHRDFLVSRIQGSLGEVFLLQSPVTLGCGGIPLHSCSFSGFHFQHYLARFLITSLIAMYGKKKSRDTPAFVVSMPA